MKIKKQADGKYYEKIVTWKKKPKYWKLVVGLLCLLFLVGYLFFNFTYLNEEERFISDKIPHKTYTSIQVNRIFSMTLCMGGSIGFALYFLFDFGGEGKKIKFKRINY